MTLKYVVKVNNILNNFSLYMLVLLILDIKAELR